MVWAYDPKINGTTLLTYASAVIIDDEGGGGREGINLHVPGKDGERADNEKTYAAWDIPIRTVLRWTNASGGITHANGADGHAFENFANLKRLFGLPLFEFSRIDPHAGLVNARLELLAKPVRGEQRHVYIWICRMVDGSWEADAASTATGNPPTVTVGGSRRVSPTITFSGAGSVTVTDASGVVSVLTALAGSFPLVVNCATLRVTQGGSPAPGRITATQPWWIRMDPGAVSIGSTVSVTVDWFNRWA